MRNPLPALTFPASLVSATENGGARRFDRETAWRFRYNLSQLPNGELPSALDLSLILGPLADTRTSLFVTLNNHLLVTRALTGDDQRLSDSIALPPAYHLDRNELQITLTAREQDELRCGAMRLIAAELLPDTVLQGGGERVITPLAAIRAALGARAPVAFESAALSAPQARSVAMLLAELRPSEFNFNAPQPVATVQAITGNVASALSSVRRQGQQWLMFYTPDERAGAQVLPFSANAPVGDADVALLVTINRAVAGQPAPAPSPSASASARTRAPADVRQ